MHTGTIDVDEDVQPSALMPHLAECLRRVKARHIAVNGNRIVFNGGFFRLVSNWNVLGPFGSGELEFLPATRQVRYRLSVAQLIVVTTALVGLLAVLMFCHSEPPPVGFIALALGLMWVFFVGGNFLIGITRFKSFLGESVSTAPEGLDEG